MRTFQSFCKTLVPPLFCWPSLWKLDFEISIATFVGILLLSELFISNHNIADSFFANLVLLDITKIAQAKYLADDSLEIKFKVVINKKKNAT
jgi:hypothetical protein